MQRWVNSVGGCLCVNIRLRRYLEGNELLGSETAAHSPPICRGPPLNRQDKVKAAIFAAAPHAPGSFLQIAEVPRPQLRAGHILLRVVACGVCRTDLHIVEGELPPLKPQLIPGHQIVGQVFEGATAEFPLGTRVGVSWLGGVDGDCWYCDHNMENLCNSPTFTGYTVDGGYAEYALVRTDFVFPLPAGLDDVHVAPLLCAGIIGFRSLRVAGVEPGERVGLFGFGSSASLAIAILRTWKCEVYVVTRGESHRSMAASLGATWVGSEDQKPPVELDRAITFAPSGKVVVSALASLRKGGVVAINAIHLDQMPAFDYDKLLWGERQIRSVANMTRQDARDLLKIAHDLNIRPQVKTFPLEEANNALLAVKEETQRGSVVIVPKSSANISA
jgi:propanol-preferring alcohol dehydrogenase